MSQMDELERLIIDLEQQMKRTRGHRDASRFVNCRIRSLLVALRIRRRNT